MGFSFKKLLEGAAADLNMFDGGKSHGNMQGRPQPASTARPSINTSQNGGLQVGQVQQPQFQAPQPLYQQALSVKPVQQPQLTVAPPAPAIKSIPVTVAQPQNLQVGNQVIAPNPTVRTSTPARNAFLDKQQNPSLVDQALSTPVGQALKVASYAPG